jgi:hypothetical protein
VWDLPSCDVDRPSVPGVRRDWHGGPRVAQESLRERGGPVEEVLTRSLTAPGAAQLAASSGATMSSHGRQQGPQ